MPLEAKTDRPRTFGASSQPRSISGYLADAPGIEPYRLVNRIESAIKVELCAIEDFIADVRDVPKVHNLLAVRAEESGSRRAE